MASHLLTTTEPAAYINQPIATLRWWRHVGEGPIGFNLGKRRVMYKRSDLDSWVEERYQADIAARGRSVLPDAAAEAAEAQAKSTAGVEVAESRAGRRGGKGLSQRPAAERASPRATVAAS